MGSLLGPWFRNSINFGFKNTINWAPLVFQSLNKHIPALFKVSPAFCGGGISGFIGSCPILQDSLVLCGGTQDGHPEAPDLARCVMTICSLWEILLPCPLAHVSHQGSHINEYDQVPKAPPSATLQRLEHGWTLCKRTFLLPPHTLICVAWLSDSVGHGLHLIRSLRKPIPPLSQLPSP